MPLSKPYPPTEISYQDWNDLADNYAGKAATLIVDVNGKGDYSTLQEAIDALPTTDAGEILVKKGLETVSKAIKIKDIEDLVIRGVGKATRFKTANKVQELIASDAAASQKEVQVAVGGSFEVGQHVCVRDDSASEVNEIAQINGDVLTMVNDLANIYEVADNGRVYTCHSTFYITGTSKNIRITNLLVDGNRLNQEFDREGYWPLEHQGDCIRVSSTCSFISVDHSWIKSAAAHGICSAGDDCRYTENDCWDSEYDGINIEPECDRILVKGNICHDQVSWNGIQVGYMTNPTGTVLVIGNHCYNNKQGIAAQGGANVAIVGNILENNREDGISLYSMDRFNVTGNLITGADDVSDMTNSGIHIEAECSIGTICGNTIELTAGYGIYGEDGAYITINGNSIRKIKKHGVYAAALFRDSTIQGNSLVDIDSLDAATYSGILVAGDRNAVVGNRLDNCDKYAIEIMGTADRTLCLGNHCYQYTGSPVGAILDEGTNTEMAHNITE